MTTVNAQREIAAAAKGALSDDELEIVLAGVSTTQPPSKAPPPLEPAARR